MASIEFDYAKETTRVAELHLEEARGIAEQADVPFDRVLLFGSQPYKAILQTRPSAIAI